MTVLRITEGEFITNIENGWTVFTDEFEAFAGDCSHFTATEGTVFGQPLKDINKVFKYFKKGWWSSDYAGKNIINNAEIGDKIYFQIELTKDFPNKNLSEDVMKKNSFKVYLFDGYKSIFVGMSPFYKEEIKKINKEADKQIDLVTWIDSDGNNEIDEVEKYSKKPYVEVVASGSRATISFNLSKSMERFFVNHYDFELFIEASYDGETVELPEIEDDFLSVTPKINEIYVKLLNYQVPSSVPIALEEIKASQQHIRGNDDKQSEKVNMDYFSLRIDKLPELEGGVRELYKLINKYFLSLASGSINFKGNGPVPQLTNMTINGKWEFKPYPKKDDNEKEDQKYIEEQVYKWTNQFNHPVFYIEADSDDLQAKPIVDHGAVVVSEFDDMCWLFTTINTEKSGSQPFSGHRQFGIHLDEDGYYRVYTRAIDRVWPSWSTKFGNFGDKDATIKDYLAIADGTWNTYISHLALYITLLGGKISFKEPKIMRVDFHKFLKKYDGEKVTCIGNIPQYKYYEK